MLTFNSTLATESMPETETENHHALVPSCWEIDTLPAGLELELELGLGLSLEEESGTEFAALGRPLEEGRPVEEGRVVGAVVGAVGAVAEDPP